MNRIGVVIVGMCLAAMIVSGVIIDNACAGDSSVFTRPAFDFIMRWVNFLILAAVIFKYGRKPIIQFLESQKTTVAQSIESLKEQKLRIEAQVADSHRQLTDNQGRLSRINDRIIAEGQTRRDQIIDEAQHDARNLMDSAKRKIDAQMLAAYADLKAELVDMAADLAARKLPAIITSDDQERWLEQWFDFQRAQDPPAK